MEYGLMSIEFQFDKMSGGDGTQHYKVFNITELFT